MMIQKQFQNGIPLIDTLVEQDHEKPVFGSWKITCQRVDPVQSPGFEGHSVLLRKCGTVWLIMNQDFPDRLRSHTVST